MTKTAADPVVGTPARRRRRSWAASSLGGCIIAGSFSLGAWLAVVSLTAALPFLIVAGVVSVVAAWDVAQGGSK